MDSKVTFEWKSGKFPIKRYTGSLHHNDSVPRDQAKLQCLWKQTCTTQMLRMCKRGHKKMQDIHFKTEFLLIKTN